MKTWFSIAILAAAAGCDSGSPPAPTIAGGVRAEPGRLRALHVLVPFRGAHNAPDTVTRTQDEAEVLAREILARARRGEDFEKLMKDYSSDPGKGNYALVNHGVPPKSGDTKRDKFVSGFTKVAFSLEVGDVGMTQYDKADSPFGYHVIKRIE